MSFKEYTFFIILLFSTSLAFCQDNHFTSSDSLLLKDFNYLRTKFYDIEISDAEASLYADAYLKKAKQLKDVKRIVEGYYHKGLIDSDPLKFKYIDSLIEYSTKHANNYFIEDALVIKAGDLLQKRAYKKALKVYVEAQKYAQKSDNKLSLFNIEYNIGVTNNLIGKYENSLKIFKKSLKNFESLAHEDQWRRLRIMSSMIISYRHLKMYDSVNHYTKKGIQQTYKRPKYEYLYNLFVLNEGINLYFKSNYTNSIDSIKKVIPYFESKNDESKLSFAYFYLGKAYFKVQNTPKAIKYFKKVDTIFLNVNYLFPETRPTYEILIDHYKKKDDLQKQLLYVQRLLLR